MVRSLYAIVAVGKNMGIGKDGALPWPPLRNELKYFHKMTTTSTQEGKQNVVIMGKKTWFSIPEKNRPLKNRINIVLSKELTEVPQKAHYLARGLDEALELLESSELASKIDMVWIVGGHSVYKFMVLIFERGETSKLEKLLNSLEEWLDENAPRYLKIADKLPLTLLYKPCKLGEVLVLDVRVIHLLRDPPQAAMDKPIHQLLFVTRILHEFESDTFFPEIDLEKYRLLPVYEGVPTDIQEENGVQYKFEVYEKSI